MSRLRFIIPIVAIMGATLFACGASTETAKETTDVESAVVPEAGVAIFPDDTLEKKIRLFLDLPEEGPILISELEKMTSLNMASGLYVADLSGMEHLANLTDFDLSQNKTIDISPLATLTNITTLNLSQNDIVDISALATLTNLTDLNLQANQISDISALASLTNLTKLILTSNNINDLSPLASLTNLTLIEFSKNNITDLSPLLEIGLGEGDTIRLWGEPLDANSIEVIIPQLEAAGVKVQF